MIVLKVLISALFRSEVESTPARYISNVIIIKIFVPPVGATRVRFEHRHQIIILRSNLKGFPGNGEKARRIWVEGQEGNN